MLFASFFLLLQIAVAAPLQVRQVAVVPQADPTPAVSTVASTVDALQDVATKLQLVIREVDRYNGDKRAADMLVRDSLETIDNLHVAIKEVDQGANIGYVQALTFIPVATSLITNAYALIRSVKAKADVLTKTEVVRTYDVLDRTYHGVTMLGQAFDKKLPGGVAGMMRGVTGNIVQNLKDVRDQFKTTEAQPMADPTTGGDYQFADPNAAAQIQEAPPAFQPIPTQAQPSRPQAPQQQGQPAAWGQGQFAAPQYQSQPQYQQPQYQQPQYQQPQYQQPQYQQPQYQQPQARPQYQPQYQGQGQGQGQGVGSYQQPQYAPYPPPPTSPLQTPVPASDIYDPTI